MSWILVIIMMSSTMTAVIEPHTQIGPFLSEKSCNRAKDIISKDVKNARFYCLRVDRK
jgi:hypothetical protein